MDIIIPFVSAVLFRLGGSAKGNKWYRWAGLGLFIATAYAIQRHSWVPLVCIPLYFISTNVVNYGETQVWRKWFGRDGAWLFYGFCFGLASFPVLGWAALIQAAIGSGAFWGLMKLSNDGIVMEQPDPDHGRIGRVWKLDHKYVEMGIGFIGTMVYFFTL